MKHNKILLLLLFCFFVFIGCTNYLPPKIENFSWRATSAQRVTNGESISLRDSESALRIDLFCRAEDGTLTLTDQTNHRIYTGTYAPYRTSLQSNIYKVMIDEKNGYASVAMTTYADKTQTPTFIITLEDYAIYFHGE